MRKVFVKAPAKVNLQLRVVGRRDDGYHDLKMVMVPLSLCDEITLTTISSGIELVIEGSADEGMNGEKNLAWRAARIVKEEAGISDGVRINMVKRIPIAAGLGGGSSDAAAVLRGMSELWGLGWSPERLAGLGKSLGADVPFFCYDGAAYTEGTGDRISLYEKFPNASYLLVNPGFAVSTPWVYKQWDLQLTMKESDASVRPLFQVFSDIIASLHNDLERVTIPAHPEIAKIKDDLLRTGAAGALMSGSGPTVFGVFASAALRDEAAARMNNGRWRLFAADGPISIRAQ